MIIPQKPAFLSQERLPLVRDLDRKRNYLANVIHHRANAFAAWARSSSHASRGLGAKHRPRLSFRKSAKLLQIYRRTPERLTHAVYSPRCYIHDLGAKPRPRSSDRKRDYPLSTIRIARVNTSRTLSFDDHIARVSTPRMVFGMQARIPR